MCLRLHLHQMSEYTKVIVMQDMHKKNMTALAEQVGPFKTIDVGVGREEKLKLSGTAMSLHSMQHLICSVPKHPSIQGRIMQITFKRSLQIQAGFTGRGMMLCG